jgi:HEAT repeat protein
MDELTAQKIIQLLEAPTDDRRPISDWILSNAPVTELILALQGNSTPLVRQILCDMLGERHERAAVPILVDCLNDASPDIRDSAADALAKIGDPSAGKALMECFAGAEREIGVRQMLALALGAVGHKPAIPLLIQALNEPNGTLRGCAAWSLGVLDAEEAKDALQRALKHEIGSDADSAYAAKRMRAAIRAISRHRCHSNKHRGRDCSRRRWVYSLKHRNRKGL